MYVPKGAVGQVMPTDKAPATGTLRTGFDFPDPPPLGLVTQLVPLQSIRADEGADALRAILAKGARIEAVARSNALLITDRGVNVARYLDLLQKLDAAPAGEAGMRTYVVNLKYAAAEDLASALGQLFGIQVATSNVGSLGDRSLTRALGTFRGRDQETFRTRPTMSNNPNQAPPPASNPVLRDSAAGLLVGRTAIVANAPTNALIIRTAPPNYPLLRRTIDALDTRPTQVLFEVTIAEITLGKGFEFGVDWSVVSKSGDVTAAFGNPLRSDSGNTNALLRLIRLDGTSVRAFAAHCRHDQRGSRAVDPPRSLPPTTARATILVGSKVPFVSSTRLANDVAIDRAVQYQDVGTKLSIIPTINDDNYVSVQLLQEVSTLTTQTIEAALSAPVISTREATTRAILRDGQTVVIAGLIGETRQEDMSGIPFLMDIHGSVPCSESKAPQSNRSELAIFVTPYLVRTDEDADRIRERIRESMEKRSPGVLDGTPVIKKPPPPPGDAREQ
jgi:general secretion pathway protein D